MGIFAVEGIVINSNKYSRMYEGDDGVMTHELHEVDGELEPDYASVRTAGALDPAKVVALVQGRMTDPQRIGMLFVDAIGQGVAYTDADVDDVAASMTDLNQLLAKYGAKDVVLVAANADMAGVVAGAAAGAGRLNPYGERGQGVIGVLDMSAGTAETAITLHRDETTSQKVPNLNEVRATWESSNDPDVSYSDTYPISVDSWVNHAVLREQAQVRAERVVASRIARKAEEARRRRRDKVLRNMRDARIEVTLIERYMDMPWEKIVQLVKAGDEAAEASLWFRYHRLVWRTIRREGDENLDTEGDVWDKVWAAVRNNFDMSKVNDMKDGIEPFIVQVAKNVVRDAHRKEKRGPEFVSGDAYNFFAYSGAAPVVEDAYTGEENEAGPDAAMATTPPRLRSVRILTKAIQRSIYGQKNAEPEDRKISTKALDALKDVHNALAKIIKDNVRARKQDPSTPPADMSWDTMAVRVLQDRGEELSKLSPQEKRKAIERLRGNYNRGKKALVTLLSDEDGATAQAFVSEFGRRGIEYFRQWIAVVETFSAPTWPTLPKYYSDSRNLNMPHAPPIRDVVLAMIGNPTSDVIETLLEEGQGRYTDLETVYQAAHRHGATLSRALANPYQLPQRKEGEEAQDGDDLPTLHGFGVGEGPGGMPRTTAVTPHKLTKAMATAIRETPAIWDALPEADDTAVLGPREEIERAMSRDQVVSDETIDALLNVSGPPPAGRWSPPEAWSHLSEQMQRNMLHNVALKRPVYNDEMKKRLERRVKILKSKEASLTTADVAKAIEVAVEAYQVLPPDVLEAVAARLPPGVPMPDIGAALDTGPEVVLRVLDDSQLGQPAERPPRGQRVPVGLSRGRVPGPGRADSQHREEAAAGAGRAVSRSEEAGGDQHSRLRLRHGAGRADPAPR